MNMTDEQLNKVYNEAFQKTVNPPNGDFRAIPAGKAAGLRAVHDAAQGELRELLELAKPYCEDMYKGQHIARRIAAALSKTKDKS